MKNLNMVVGGGRGGVGVEEKFQEVTGISFM